MGTVPRRPVTGSREVTSTSSRSRRASRNVAGRGRMVGPYHRPPMPAASAAPTAILLIRCPDQHGLVARTAQFVAERNGNVVHADHHIDRATGLFLMRLEWELDGFEVARDCS